MKAVGACLCLVLLGCYRRIDVPDAIDAPPVIEVPPDAGPVPSCPANVDWVALFGDRQAQGVHDIAEATNGAMVVVGSFSSRLTGAGSEPVSTGRADAFAVKLSATGDVLWVRAFGDADGNIQGFESVAVDSQGNPWVLGYFDDAIELDDTTIRRVGTISTFLVRLAGDDGAILGVWDLGAVLASDLALTELEQFPIAWVGGSLLDGAPCPGMPGDTCDIAGSTDLFLMRISTHPSVTSRLFPLASPGDESLAALSLDTSGRIVMTGSASGTLDIGNAVDPPMRGAAYAFVAALETTLEDTMPATLWVRRFASTACGNPASYGHDVAWSTAGDTVVAVGAFTTCIEADDSTHEGEGAQSGYLVAMSGATGAVQEWQAVNARFSARLTGLAPASDGSFWVAGSAWGSVSFGAFGSVVDLRRFAIVVARYEPGEGITSAQFWGPLDDATRAVRIADRTLPGAGRGFALGTMLKGELRVDPMRSFRTLGHDAVVMSATCP